MEKGPINTAESAMGGVEVAGLCNGLQHCVVAISVVKRKVPNLVMQSVGVNDREEGLCNCFPTMRALKLPERKQGLAQLPVLSINEVGHDPEEAVVVGRGPDVNAKVHLCK